jgi:hypothetical protein
VPDSLTALAVLALVGVPGYVYLQLVPRKRGEQDRSELNQSLETIFFGLACALGGVVISLTSQDHAWTALLQPTPVSEAGAEAVLPPLAEHGPVVIGVAFLGSLVTAVLAASLVHLVRAAARRFAERRSAKQSTGGLDASEAAQAPPRRDRRKAKVKALGVHERSAGHAVGLLVVAALGVGIALGLGRWSDSFVADDTSAACAETAGDDSVASGACLPR